MRPKKKEKEKTTVNAEENVKEDLEKFIQAFESNYDSRLARTLKKQPLLTKLKYVFATLFHCLRHLFYFIWNYLNSTIIIRNLPYRYILDLTLFYLANWTERKRHFRNLGFIRICNYSDTQLFNATVYLSMFLCELFKLSVTSINY